MDIYNQLAEKIISEQEKIIGPVAIDQARQVPGVVVNWDGKHEVNIEGDKKKAIEELVEKYQDLFGKLAIEVCRDAVKSLVNDTSKTQLPQILM